MSKKADEGWTGKNKMPPNIPPYKAPRAVSVTNIRKTRSKPVVVVISEKEDKDSESEEEKMTENDSQVQLLSETQNQREIEARRLAVPPLVKPYPRGIKLMSAREADEEAKHGEVLRWSSNSDSEETKDRNEDMRKAEKTTEEPAPIVYVGQAWGDKTLPFVLITGLGA
jgi:hypothetical protein